MDSLCNINSFLKEQYNSLNVLERNRAVVKLSFSLIQRNRRQAVNSYIISRLRTKAEEERH